MESTNRPKIAVIGAGLAGLTAAYRLLKNGMDVYLYEAKGRVGGRVLTVQVEGHPGELGGQNIYDGGEAENLLALIDEMGLKTISRQSFLNLNYIEGQKSSNFKDLLKLYRFTSSTLKAKLEKISQSAANMEEVLQELFADNQRLKSLLSLMLTAYEGLAPGKLSTVYIETLYHMLLGGLSAVHQASEAEASPLELGWIEGGNAMLPQALAKKLSSRIHYHEVLAKVQKGRGQSYQLTFESGRRIEADFLVLAIPCSVFSKIEFEESLILSQRLKDIRNVDYGTNSKIVMPLPNYGKGNIQYTDGRFITFSHDLHTLALYHVGDYGCFTSQTIQSVYEKDLPLIKWAYGIEVPGRAFYGDDGAFSSYAGPVGYSWASDPFAKGSYSCIAAGQEEAMTKIETFHDEKVRSLFAPIGNTLFFAGEHTTILFKASATMEAAVESGERTARLISSLCMSKPV